jgi:hypothetical protein
MGTLRAAVTAVSLIAFLVTAPGRPTPAGATTEPAAPTGSQAICVAQWTDALTPGISLTPSTVSFTSNGPTGTITCVGSVRGHAVTGPGTFGEQGTIRGTCTSGSGEALFVMTIPTDGGPATVILPAVFTTVGTVGLRPTGTFPGGFVAVPTQGDCVTTPVTQIAVVLHGTLTT